MLLLSCWRNRLALLLTLGLIGILPGLAAPLSAQADEIRMIFMHHSVGRRLIEEGLLKERLAEHHIALWDHGYNDDGLVTPEWDWLGTHWDVPGDNTDPDGWVTIFNQPVTSPPTNTFSHMLEYDVIAFKSCYPNADIYDDGMLETYKAYYREIRDIMDQHPDKLFIIITNPPLNPVATSPDAAARAIEWAAYLASDEFLDGHPNVVTFDFFSLLADENGMLREDYQPGPRDSHPNRLANETIGPLFVDFVTQALEDFTPGEARVVPQPAGSVTENPADDPADDPLDDPADDPADDPLETSRADAIAVCFPPFDENNVANGLCTGQTWSWEGNGSVVWEVVEPGDGQPPHALEITFDLVADDYGGAGFHFAPNPDWADAAGIAFAWRASAPGLSVNFSLGVHDPAHPEEDEAAATPFEYRLTTTDSADWETVVILWDDFVKARWWGEQGVNVFDPANVVWASYGVGEAGIDQAGTLWIADLHIVTAE